MSSDSEPEELLMATRARRANAGNKMQKLLQQELEEVQKQTGGLAEDDISLLFQEDEEDDEFVVESKKREEDENMFSDSEEESSGHSEADEGEVELQKQERQKRKLAQKSKNKIPVIKRAKKASSEKPTKSATDEINAESLLAVSRRTSKRSAVVANKLKVYENLTQAERRRKHIQEKLRKQREKQNLKALTQEERLKIAEETERINTSSLNKYKEQEISKKQTRMAMQLREKMKFKDGEQIIRWISTQWEVSPIVEIEDRAYWEQYTAKRDKTKKKYVRRKKAQIEADNLKEAQKNIVSDSGTEPVFHPVVQTDTELAEISEEKSLTPSDENSNRADSPTSEEAVSAEIPSLPPKKETHSNPEINEGVVGGHENIEMSLADENASAVPKEIEVHETAVSNETLDMADKKPQAIDEAHMPNTGGVALSPVAPDKFRDEQSIKSDATVDIAHSFPGKESNSSRHIAFAEEDQVSVINSEDPPMCVQMANEVNTDDEIPKDEEDETEVVEEGNADIQYEGPVQRVGKNFIILYSFPDMPYPGHSSKIKSTLFGQDWMLPTKARPDEVETIAKITSVVDEEPMQAALLPDTSVLEKFPRFGEFDKKTLRTVTIDSTKKEKIEIRTEAPTGVFLPNGVRKNCLITNKECKYFDPKNGVPYSDVEAIKTIQQLQEYYDENGEPIEPAFKWFGFARGGIFLDILQRPAKGVPDGFI